MIILSIALALFGLVWLCAWFEGDAAAPDIEEELAALAFPDGMQMRALAEIRRLRRLVEGDAPRPPE